MLRSQSAKCIMMGTISLYVASVVPIHVLQTKLGRIAVLMLNMIGLRQPEA